ncbi:MAG: nucleoside hydrolase [Eubacterium sp.]|nr:nucleoside hydrolase [Eubacterium sp.]
MEKKKIIIDTDPGIDDSLAIMLALVSPEVEVVGISIVCGNCPVDMGFENAKKVLKFMGRLDIPIYKGEKKPLKREYIDALDTHGKDGLGESFLENVPGYEKEIDAVTFMADILKREKCSVIALGPMTNLARLIEKDREAFEAIESIVSMGGCFKSYGNCSPVAEYNYWCDPDAAKTVYKAAFDADKKISMIGLDVTRKIVLTPTRLEYIMRKNEKAGDFIKKITKFYYDFHWEWEHIIGCVINDPLAVAYFLDKSICSGFESYVDIETGGISIGQSVVDEMAFYKMKSNAVVLNEVNTEKFWEMFFERITGINN